MSQAEHHAQAVPAYALGISVVALAVPVGIVYWLPDWTSNGLGMLIWLTALIPAFLLSYYRGLRGVAVALAGGMAVITATQLSVVVFAVAEPDWTLFLGVIGVYLAVALGIGGLSEALLRERRSAQALALVDPLTQLPNRRHLEIMLTGEFAAAERGTKASVVMFDLDHFKVVNDRHGHNAGDRTLQAFARILQSNTRAENISARFGGEEFVSVLRGSDANNAEIFAERILDEMRAWALPWGNQTVSAGVAEYEPGMGSYELLLGAADLALYRAKEAGRDCVFVAQKGGALPGPAGRATDVWDPPTPESAAKPFASASRVWVVDDNAHMRSVLKSMLARGGYESWDTGNPLHAIKRFALMPAERPDVIVADVIMPEMSGIRMIEEIAKIDPLVRVIYMSGFVQSAISWGGTAGAEVAFLEKPVMIEALNAALKRVLEPQDVLTASSG